MEASLLDWGFSHTWSKIIPYVLVILFGCFLAYLVYRRFSSNKKMAITLGLFFVITPFIAYFAVNPIYEDDFSVTGSQLDLKNTTTEALGDGLLVLAIPGCPYCLEAIDGLKAMKKKNKQLRIEFAVIGTFSEDGLAKYKEASAGKFPVVALENEQAFTNFTGHNFPTFVMIEKGKAVHFWTNNQFGVRAKDRVEIWK